MILTTNTKSHTLELSRQRGLSTKNPEINYDVSCA